MITMGIRELLRPPAASPDEEVRAAVEMLAESVEQGDAHGPETLEHLREMQESTTHAAALTRQLLAFGRRQHQNPRIIDPNRALDELGPILRQLVREDIFLTLDPGTDAPSVRVDPTQLDQVILNLVTNARDAMPDGGDLVLSTCGILVTEEESALEPNARPGPHLALSVSDTGTGMDRGTRERIFEPFFSTKREGEGTGLGLASVHGIVAQSGGFLTVESELGVGTTISVLLPEVSGLAEEPVEEEPVPAAVVDGQTVLLCEDNDGVRGVAKKALEGEGYQVLSASSPERALELADVHPSPVDLLITDVVMPGMNGRVLADQVKELRPKIQILYISGYTADTIIPGLDDPLVDLLEKPFTVQALLSRVAASLGQRRS